LNAKYLVTVLKLKCCLGLESLSESDSYYSMDKKNA